MDQDKSMYTDNFIDYSDFFLSNIVRINLYPQTKSWS